MAQLMSDELGRLIAADSDRVKRFAALQSSLELPPPDYIERQAVRVTAILDPLEKALKDSKPFMPDEAIEAQLARELEPTVRYLDAFSVAHAGVEALLADARRAEGEPAPVALSVKLAEVEQHYAELRLQELARARDAIEEENRKKMATLEKRKLAEVAEAERARREAELEAHRKREEAEATLASTRATRAGWVAMAKSPDIQARYQVFLQKGRYSFARDCLLNTAAFPVSYNALQRCGILTDLQMFAAAVSGAGRSLNRKYYTFGENDRPLWNVRPTSDAEWQWMRERFRVFRNVAPIWREMGLLNP